MYVSTTRMEDNYTDYLLSDDQMQAVAIVNAITSTLSGLGAGSILVCSVYHQRMCIPEIYPILHLSVADLLASLCFLTSTVLYLTNVANFPGSSGPCDYITAVMTSFYISTLFLTFSYALEAYLRIRKRLTSNTTSREQQTVVSFGFMHLVYAVCWILPLLGAVILVIFTHYVTASDNHKSKSIDPAYVIPTQCSTCLPVFHYSQDHPCWSYVENGSSWHLAYKLVFLLPLITIFLINICIMCTSTRFPEVIPLLEFMTPVVVKALIKFFTMILYVYIARAYRQAWERRGVYSVHQHQEESTLRRKAILYQSAFLFCWLPTLVLGIISFTSTFQMRTYFWLYLLQSIFGPLQGFLNCIIYGWKRRSFVRALSESSSLTSTNMPSYLSLTL